MENGIYFVSGIDTDAGKSYATGFLAKELNEKGQRTITQKFIQTGNNGYSEDILLHRRIMNIPLTEDDRNYITMPEIYSYPCSPHLAAEIDNRPVNLDNISQCTQILADKYDVLLIEGAGGLMVPITQDYLTIDYIAEKKYPLILVTSGKLGSINHTLLSLEAIQKRNIKLSMVMYNLYPPVEDTTIQKDTQEFIQNFLHKYYPNTAFMTVPML